MYRQNDTPKVLWTFFLCGVYMIGWMICIRHNISGKYKFAFVFLSTVIVRPTMSTLWTVTSAPILTSRSIKVLIPFTFHLIWFQISQLKNNVIILFNSYYFSSYFLQDVLQNDSFKLDNTFKHSLMIDMAKVRHLY